MYIFHLILLPVLLAALVAVFYKLRAGRYVDAAMLTVIFATIIANGLATVQVIRGDSLNVGVYMLQAFLSCLIVPSCYIYFCHTLGFRCLNGVLLTVSSLVLLIFLPNVCIVENLSHFYEEGNYDFVVPHCLNVILGGKNVFHVTLEGVVIMLQGVVVLWRTIRLDILMHRYELVYTPKMRMFITWAISCILFAIIYHALPAHTWAGSTGAWVYFSIYALLGFTGFLAIALNMEIRTVVTRDGAETVQMDRFMEGNKDLARRMRELFDKEEICLRQGLVIDDVAEMLGTNRTYFTRMMRAEFGMSFTEFVQHSRVEYCKRRLLQGDDSLEDIAFDAGFGSASNLSRVFKKHVGRTPDEFRKRHVRQ